MEGGRHPQRKNRLDVAGLILVPGGGKKTCDGCLTSINITPELADAQALLAHALLAGPERLPRRVEEFLRGLIHEAAAVRLDAAIAEGERVHNQINYPSVST